MSEQEPTTPEVTETPTPEPVPTATPPAAEKNTDTPAEHMIPKARFDEVNSELKQIRADMAKAQKEREKAEAAALAEQGKFKELYESTNAELEGTRPYKEKYETLLTGIAETNAKRIEAIPENMRTLVPSFDDPLQVQAWLDANDAHLKTRPVAPDLNGGSRSQTTNNNAPPASEIIELAAVLNVSPESLAHQYGVTLPEK